MDKEEKVLLSIYIEDMLIDLTCEEIERLLDGEVIQTVEPWLKIRRSD
jgi:hypothetical protein